MLIALEASKIKPSDIDPIRLRELALDIERRAEFVSACQAWITAGREVSGIAAAIRETPWRFILTNSGQAIEVEHVDELEAAYWEAVDEMNVGRSCIGNEGHEEYVLEGIRNCLKVHRRASQFMTFEDDFARVEDAISDLFEGTGYIYNGENSFIPEDE